MLWKKSFPQHVESDGIIPYRGFFHSAVENGAKARLPLIMRLILNKNVADVPVDELSTIWSMHPKIVYYTGMEKTYSQTELETIRSFFTESEWDAIDSALADFQDYGETETNLMNSIGDKMYNLFNVRYQDENRHPNSGGN